MFGFLKPKKKKQKQLVINKAYHDMNNACIHKTTEGGHKLFAFQCKACMIIILNEVYDQGIMKEHCDPSFHS